MVKGSSFNLDTKERYGGRGCGCDILSAPNSLVCFFAPFFLLKCDEGARDWHQARFGTAGGGGCGRLHSVLAYTCGVQEGPNSLDANIFRRQAVAPPQ